MLVSVIGAALFILAYAYVGYPIAISVLSRLFPCKLDQDPSYEPKVSVLIPVFNAASSVGAKLDSLLSQDYPQEKIEILVYSDGSTDESESIVEEYAGKHPGLIRLIRAEKRAGKPTALNRMRKEATGDVFVLTDIRQALSENAIRALVLRLSDKTVGTASGNLMLVGATGAGFYWKYENAIRKAEASFRSMIGVTGPLYAIRRDDLPEVPVDTILDDMWIPMRLRLAGKRLVFVPEAIASDQAFEDDREFGRKVRTLAGNYQLFARLPALLVPFVNPIWFETFSHKILRLVCPWAMIVCVVATIAGLFNASAPPLYALGYKVLLGGEILFALMAAVGPAAGKLTGAARTFVVLNYAAIVGLWRFLRGSQRITW